MKNCLACTKSRQRRKAAGMAMAIGMGERSHGSAGASLPGYVDIRRSSIPNAGNGVFANTLFRAGDPIIMVTGTFVPTQGQPLAKQKYSFDIPDHPRVALQCYDDAETNIVKYINSAHSTPRRPNSTLVWHGCMPIVYAKEDIRPGEEILLDYTF